ncbi:MAG: hypothetical protein EHM72_18555 [Calditrichaeota bacterium]|nr:MAG: hypothetical protein EHM72_18555 [Calditrichota bacterium]
MKNISNKFWVLLALVVAPLVSAQDIQEKVDQARQALLIGDYRTAMNLAADANTQIQNDPKLDPNSVFSKRLLPKIEKSATSMAAIIKLLDELERSQEANLEFPDMPPTKDAVVRYSQLAREAVEKLINQRESILIADYELEPEYREALRHTPQYKRIDELVTTEIIEKLTGKFQVMVGVLTDSIKSITAQVQKTEKSLTNMKKSADASKAQQEKLEQQLAELSQERLKYMTTISEMLMGEATAENEELRMVLLDENLDSVFSNVIQSEIERIKQISEIDSTGYKELLSNYERIKKYNQIFAKNLVTHDQWALMANYESALKKVRVVEPSRPNYLLYFIFIAAVLAAVWFLYKIITSSKSAPDEEFQHDYPEEFVTKQREFGTDKSNQKSETPPAGPKQKPNGDGE